MLLKFINWGRFKKCKGGGGDPKGFYVIWLLFICQKKALKGFNMVEKSYFRPKFKGRGKGEGSDEVLPKAEILHILRPSLMTTFIYLTTKRTFLLGDEILRFFNTKRLMRQSQSSIFFCFEHFYEIIWGL